MTTPVPSWFRAKIVQGLAPELPRYAVYLPDDRTRAVAYYGESAIHHGKWYARLEAQDNSYFPTDDEARKFLVAELSYQRLKGCTDEHIAP